MALAGQWDRPRRWPAASIRCSLERLSGCQGDRGSGGIPGGGLKASHCGAVQSPSASVSSPYSRIIRRRRGREMPRISQACPLWPSTDPRLLPGIRTAEPVSVVADQLHVVGDIGRGLLKISDQALSQVVEYHYPAGSAPGIEHRSGETHHRFDRSFQAPKFLLGKMPGSACFGGRSFHLLRKDLEVGYDRKEIREDNLAGQFHIERFIGLGRQALGPVLGVVMAGVDCGHQKDKCEGDREEALQDFQSGAGNGVWRLRHSGMSDPGNHQIPAGGKR